MRVDEKPIWIDSTSRLTGDNFKKVVIFSIINCPVNKKTARARKLPNNIKVPIDLIMKNNAGEIEEGLLNKNLMIFPPTGDWEERAVFVKSQKNKAISFIDHIRNSLAHGRFNVVLNAREEYLVMEDRDSNGACSARIIVKVRTLKEWFEGFEN